MLRLQPCDLLGEGVECEEPVALGCVRQIADAGLGIDLGYNVRAIKVLGSRLNEQQFAGCAGHEVNAAGLILLIVRAIGRGETHSEQDDQWVTGLTQGAADLFLALGDSCADMYNATLGGCEAVGELRIDLRLSEAARALHHGMHGVLGEEHVPQHGAWGVGYGVLLMDAEQVGVSALECQAAGVGFDVSDEAVYLSIAVYDSFMIICRIGLPYAADPRKYTRKGEIACSWAIDLTCIITPGRMGVFGIFPFGRIFATMFVCVLFMHRQRQ